MLATAWRVCLIVKFRFSNFVSVDGQCVEIAHCVMHYATFLFYVYTRRLDTQGCREGGSRGSYEPPPPWGTKKILAMGTRTPLSQILPTPLTLLSLCCCHRSCCMLRSFTFFSPVWIVSVVCRWSLLSSYFAIYANAGHRHSFENTDATVAVVAIHGPLWVDQFNELGTWLCVISR